MNKPKFNIGDVVYNKMVRKGTYEPSTVLPNTKLEVEGIRRSGSIFIYTCGFDGYEFKEDELMSKEEYIKKVGGE